MGSRLQEKRIANLKNIQDQISVAILENNFISEQNDSTMNLAPTESYCLEQYSHRRHYELHRLCKMCMSVVLPNSSRKCVLAFGIGDFVQQTG
jgi:chromosome condensin MukBEF complex kleisin-like MukF subunit